jgi:hypothetical protein
MAKKPEPPQQIAAAAATMTGSGFTGAGDAGVDLQQRMHNALKKAQAEGLDDAAQGAAVRAAIERYRNGEPE